jgi:hypothetical protein
VGLTTPLHKKTAVTERQERRPRPDMGCRAIGWMDFSVPLCYVRESSGRNLTLLPTPIPKVFCSANNGHALSQ